MTDIFLVLAGFLMGLSFLGGFYLFCIPVGIIALVFGWLNRPKSGSAPPSLTKPITERLEKFVRPQPAGTQFVSEKEPQEYNEPSSALSRRKIWEEVENDVEECLYDALQLIKKLMPDIYTAAVFFPSKLPGHFEMKSFCSESASVVPKATLGTNHGLVGQLIKKDAVRILEGDIQGGRTLYYYSDDPPVRSIAAVPIIQGQKTRGCVVIDSLKPNAFTGETISLLKNLAKIVGTTAYMSYMKALNFIKKDQFDVLYRYQQNFFRNMTVKDIYTHIANYVKTSIPYDRLMILALDRRDEGIGHVVTADGLDADYFINQEFNLNDQGLLVLALLKNIPLERNIPLGDEDLVRVKKMEKSSEGLRCIMAVPVVTDPDTNKSEMVISIESRQPDRYTEHELGLLKHIASAAGFAFLRTRAFEEKQELASRDSLTGLINHRTLHEKLRIEKLRSDRQSTSIGLMMLDIDKFKNINDTYGHPAGDVVIKTISRILQKEVRQEIDVVARYGGEEFVVMLVDTNEQGLRETAERVRKAVETREFDIERAEPVRVTVSIGVYLLKTEFRDTRKALEFADQALYKAKNSGRNRVVEYN
ncbi:MAG TPA: sensor domain-containing diguanylate cyclase [Fibrobacteraceae bacterium]|nr:sensor domain-containing diguanylate cyclase [Fibrobacteraceae bacterium]